MAANPDVLRVWPLIKALHSYSEESWGTPAQRQALTPTKESFPASTDYLGTKLPYAPEFKFPVEPDQYFLLPPLPEFDFVGYLAFDWTFGRNPQGSYHVYLVHKKKVGRFRSGRSSQPIEAFVVRLETANELPFAFSHAQSCCRKRPTHYPRAIQFQSQKMIPKGSPHLPLLTHPTPVGFLLTLTAALYGTGGKPFTLLAAEEMSEHERALVRRLMNMS
ncbi:MAG: hypothetical protein ACYDCK_11400 [Thermoplasmatota archaeon]